MKILAVIYAGTEVIDVWKERKGKFMSEDNFICRFIGEVTNLYQYANRWKLDIKKRGLVTATILADSIQKGD